MHVCVFLCVSVFVSLSVDCRSQVLFQQLVKERAVRGIHSDGVIII